MSKATEIKLFLLLICHLGGLSGNPKMFLISTKDSPKHSAKHSTKLNKGHKSISSNNINHESETGQYATHLLTSHLMFLLKAVEVEVLVAVEPTAPTPALTKAHVK